jgi:propionyl-CoA carboxylase beta chain
MGAQQAVSIIHRREIAAAEDPQAELERLSQIYAEEHQGAWAAAREGSIDEVVLPAETRERLAAAIGALASKRGASGGARNIPL